MCSQAHLLPLKQTANRNTRRRAALVNQPRDGWIWIRPQRHPHTGRDPEKRDTLSNQPPSPPASHQLRYPIEAAEDLAANWYGTPPLGVVALLTHLKLSASYRPPRGRCAWCPHKAASTRARSVRKWHTVPATRKAVFWRCVLHPKPGSSHVSWSGPRRRVTVDASRSRSSSPDLEFVCSARSHP